MLQQQYQQNLQPKSKAQGQAAGRGAYSPAPNSYGNPQDAQATGQASPSNGRWNASYGNLDGAQTKRAEHSRGAHVGGGLTSPEISSLNPLAEAYTFGRAGNKSHGGSWSTTPRALRRLSRSPTHNEMQSSGHHMSGGDQLPSLESLIKEKTKQMQQRARFGANPQYRNMGPNFQARNSPPPMRQMDPRSAVGWSAQIGLSAQKREDMNFGSPWMTTSETPQLSTLDLRRLGGDDGQLLQTLQQMQMLRQETQNYAER